nr:reverse transcriptase domain-containing protein [Tanacetum cinerariifolium]
MTSFGYRSNPRYAIKECSSCGTLHTRDCVCSIGAVKDKILVPKPPKNYTRCTRCGYLVDGPNCQRCALLRQELEENLVTHSPDFQNTSEPSNASINVVNAPREPYVVKQDNGSFIEKISCDLNRAPASPNQFHCFHYKDVLRDEEACKRCTCAKCGSGLGKGLCYICGHNQNSLNDSPSISETSSQSPSNINHCCYECGDPLDGIFCKRCTCKSCGKDAHIGYNCPSKFSLNYEPEPGYSQNYNSYPHDSPSFPQQYPCCEDCGVTHEPYQCQPKNQDYYHEQNSCYDSNSIGSDQSQPQQYTVNHPIFSAHHDLLGSQKKLNMTLTTVTEQMTQLTSMCEMACQIVQKNIEEKQLEEEQAAKARTWKLPVCYDDDDDEESSNSLEDNIISELPSYSAVTPTEPIDSLSMEDEHLNAILATESDEFIKSCVENLVPNPSESEGENGCDVLACFTTFSNVIFDDDYDFDSSDDQSLSDEDVPEKIYSNPLFDEEIIPMEIDQHSFNAESDLIESMPNHDSSITISLKIYSLFDEFAGELTLLKSIPPGIDETDCQPEKEIQIDLSFNPDDPMSSGIEGDDYDSGRDILIIEELLDNYSLSLPNNESYQFDIPSPYRPPAKPLDGNTGTLNIKMLGDEKSSDLLSHQGFEAFQPSAECPMIIYGKNIPLLDVLLFHFYPLNQFKRVPFEQRNNPPQHPRIVYPSILNINYFRHFLDILRNHEPKDDEPMWPANCVVASTSGSAITIPETVNEFAIKGSHLTLVKGNQFVGRTKTDPHKHIHEFLGIYDMFKYKDTKNEDVCLIMFLPSLTKEAKTWLDELNEGTIKTQGELRIAFIGQFFPPALFD